MNIHKLSTTNTPLLVALAAYKCVQGSSVHMEDFMSVGTESGACWQPTRLAALSKAFKLLNPRYIEI